MRDVRIDILGSVNTGKTSIAYKLKQVLESYGTQVEVNDFDERLPDIEKALASLSEKIKVTINVKQLLR